MAETQEKATQSQHAEQAQERRKRLEPALEHVKALAGESIPWQGLLGVSVMELPAERHAALLGEPRFSHSVNNAQKARMVTELQGTYGNAYVQRVVNRIHTKRDNRVSGNQHNIADIERRIAAQKGSGQPLATETRFEMEDAFKQDFSHVRIHADVTADKLAAELSAKAFTWGKDIFFRESAYKPASKAGNKLLAHELTHVVQQDNAPAPATGEPRVGALDDQYEREADVIAESVVANAEPRTPTGMSQRRLQRHPDDGGGILGGILREAIMHSPRLLAAACWERATQIGQIVSELEEAGGASYYVDQFVDISTELVLLSGQLQASEEEETTEEQRTQASSLFERSEQLAEDLEEENAENASRELIAIREQVEQVRLQIVGLYRVIYASGKDDTTRIALSRAGEQTTSLREISGHVVSILSAIQTADADIAARRPPVLLPLLSNALAFANLILGWNFTAPLASQLTEDMNQLRNGLSVATTITSLVGLGRFNPFFGHIGILLGGIARGWERVQEGMRSYNRQWWELREIMGEELPYPGAMPGGGAMFNYMRQVFAGESPVPDDAVVEFFNERRDMFNAVATQLMERYEIPTESWFLFWRQVNPGELTGWVYSNRQWIWRLLYGDWPTPDEE